VAEAGEVADDFLEGIVIIDADGVEILLVEELINEDERIADGAQVEDGLGDLVVLDEVVDEDAVDEPVLGDPSKRELFHEPCIGGEKHHRVLVIMAALGDAADDGDGEG